jgi:hypothetical protein
MQPTLQAADLDFSLPSHILPSTLTILSCTVLLFYDMHSDQAQRRPDLPEPLQVPENS